MDARIRRAMRTVHELLAENISVTDLCVGVNLSVSRLRQLFKTNVGISPKQYIRCVRLNRAASLLRTSFLSVKEISFQIGSKDVSHLVRDFKKQFGVTPSEFRAQVDRITKAHSPESGRVCGHDDGE